MYLAEHFAQIKDVYNLIGQTIDRAVHTRSVTPPQETRAKLYMILAKTSDILGASEQEIIKDMVGQDLFAEP